MGNAYRSVLALKPTGNAVPANVLAGKTFSNADGTGKTGTMVNNGAVSITLTNQDPTYTIPEGYHNGLGIVRFTSSGGDGADLVVTCASAYSGLTISCSNGSTTYQKTCPTSSPYQVTFESIPTGTWTISGTIEGQTFSTTILISDFEATLGAIPEGSTVLPTDNIQTWLFCAGIFDKNYTTISQVLADSSTTQALIASNNAVDYMVRSTTWANDVTANENAMTYIGLNDYCSDSLLSDSTWVSSICSSSYFEQVLSDKIPTMTSNTAPEGVASAGHVYDNHYAYYAFDGFPNTTWWYTNLTGASSWIQYQFVTAMRALKLQAIIGLNSADVSFCPDGITVLASNDGSNFDTLLTQSLVKSASGLNLDITIPNANKYTYYRVLLANSNSGYGIGQVRKLQLYGRE